MDPIVSTRSLALAYEGNPVLSDLDIDAYSGEVLAIVGPNGAGKTTLLRAISGSLAIAGGELRCCGKVAGARARLDAGNRISYAPAYPDVDPWLSALDVVISYRMGPGSPWARPSDGDRRASEESLERLGIRMLAPRRMSEMSSGERKMVMLAAALSRGSDVLLLDEPLASLDLRNQSVAMAAIRAEATRGALVIVTSHELHLLRLYVDRVLVLSGGVPVALGPVEDVLKEDLLERAYGVSLRNERALVPSLDLGAGRLK
ncbi:MAG: ABC transporter ATP-binding protein [Conexivisphaera sp.]|jgi:iron complex transport system ATP-binding protein|nr:MAG: ABC transporter [Nitrososphaera sp.]